MTQEKDMQENIKLEIVRTETIHVTSGENKIPSLCFIVKDSEATNDLLTNPLPLPSMIITEVIPLKDNPDRATIAFRNLTAEEIAARNRGLLLPPGSLKEVFGDLLNLTGFDSGEVEVHTSLNEMPEDAPEAPDKINPTPSVDQTEESATDKPEASEDAPSEPEEANLPIIPVNEISDEITNILGKEASAEVQGLLDKIRGAFTSTKNLIPSDNKNIYVIETSLADAHLALMLCLNSNSPAFVLGSESTYTAPSAKNEVIWEDFLAVVDFPFEDTPEYFDATALLIQAVTGHFPLNITPEEIFQIRYELISSVARIANGSRPALVQAFGLINRMNKTVKHSKAKVVPTKEDALNTFRETMVNNLYRVTDPRGMEQLLRGPDFPTFGDQNPLADSLLLDSGLEAIFDDIMEEEYSTNGFSLKEEATVQEIIEYYKARLTPTTLPEGLKPLEEKYLNMPILFDKDWVGKVLDVEITETNAGEILVAKLIAVAVRFARLIEIANRGNIEVIPYALLIQGMLFPGENATWAYVEATKGLVTGKEDESFVFDTLLAAGSPPTYTNPNEFLPTSLIAIAHRFTHYVIEQWDIDTLVPYLSEAPIWQDMLVSVKETIVEGEGTVEEQEASGRCPIIGGFLTYLMREQPPVLLLSHETGQFIKTVSELTLLRDTVLEQGTEEWDKAMIEFIQDRFGI